MFNPGVLVIYVRFLTFLLHNMDCDVHLHFPVNIVNLQCIKQFILF